MQVENGETGVVITEFTITNGVGGWFDGWTYGGGVYVMGSVVTLTHKIIKGNDGDMGGGVCISSVSPSTIEVSVEL